MPVFARTIRVNWKLVLKMAGIICILVYAGFIINSSVGNRHIETMSWSVANKLIVIDPGHGGKDPGVVEGDLIEKEITLPTAKKLATILGQAGAVVTLTRENDTELTDPRGESFASWKREDLNVRVGMANQKKADLFLSIHANSFPSGPRQHGAQTFSQPGAEESKILAKCIQGELVRILGNNHRQARQVDYYVLRKAEMPAVIIEIGFITNPKEGKQLGDSAYQSKVAYAIYAGVVKYFCERADYTGAPAADKNAIKMFSNPPAPINAP